MKELSIFSIGGTSSWCYHKASRTLFDCGEGVAMKFGAEIFGIERILCTHGHGDHIFGLLGIINMRAFSKGDNNKPLDVYYDTRNPYFVKFKDFVNERFDNLPFKLTFIPIQNYMKVELGTRLYAIALPVRHGKHEIHSWALIERRTRLKEEYKNLIGAEFAKLKKSGVELSESYEHCILCYSLDSSHPEDFEDLGRYLKNCDVWVADSTFLKERDREDLTHMTKDDCLKVIERLNIKKTYLCHFSNRYNGFDLPDDTDKYIHVRGFWESEK